MLRAGGPKRAATGIRSGWVRRGYCSWPRKGGCSPRACACWKGGSVFGRGWVKVGKVKAHTNMLSLRRSQRSGWVAASSLAKQLVFDAGQWCIMLKKHGDICLVLCHWQTHCWVMGQSGRQVAVPRFHPCSQVNNSQRSGLVLLAAAAGRWEGGCACGREKPVKIDILLLILRLRWRGMGCAQLTMALSGLCYLWR